MKLGMNESNRKQILLVLFYFDNLASWFLIFSFDFQANMLRAYLTEVAEKENLLQFEDPKVLVFKRLIFSLCLFHSVLLEREKFGPLGFNISYEFTNGDLTICMSQLQMYIMEYDVLPFKVKHRWKIAKIKAYFMF